MPSWLQKRSAKLCIYLAIFVPALVLVAPSAGVQGASAIARGFVTDDTGIVSGALVSLKEGTGNSVERSSTGNLDRLVGVVGEGSLIELSDGEGTIQVVTTGEAVALVSDINGDIKAGDKITASPISGVGMKALPGTVVIGTAQVDLATVNTETRSVTDKSGERQTVHIGAVPLQVDKIFYEAAAGESAFVPAALQDFADSLAGHSVSPIRVMIAGFLILFVFVTMVVILYSSIRSSIISIGRNPLSENAVHKSLLQVGLTVFGVMTFTVIIIYLILTI